jgi:hypothetical protein
VTRYPLTAGAVVVALVAAAIQYTVPDAVPALQRDADALAHGEWWRVATPVLVQTLGWYQVVANLVTLALIGAIAEAVVGRRWWIVLFVAGTAGGQVAAYAWDEPGGGSSIAICGLAGGLVVAQIVAPPPLSVWTVHPVVYYLAALAGWAVLGAVTAVLACVVTAIALVVLRLLPRVDAERTALAATLAVAVALLVVRDLHGAATTAGAATMAAGLLPRRGRDLGPEQA